MTELVCYYTFRSYQNWSVIYTNLHFLFFFCSYEIVRKKSESMTFIPKARIRLNDKRRTENKKDDSRTKHLLSIMKRARIKSSAM